MGKLILSDEWWTSPAEGESGGLVIVTGRRDMEEVMATGRFTERVEVSWKYEGESNGMPDVATSTRMEEVQNAIREVLKKDPVAVLTGIYTGDNLRNWVFYAISTHIFQKKINEALSGFELLPLTMYAEHDEEWNEYKEMRELTEIK